MRRWLVGLIVLWATGTADAATINAASCSRDHVNTALQSAQAGDTVQIPACSGASAAHWTSGIIWTAPANVTVLGAGSLTTTGGGDATVIIDDYAANAILLNITVAATGTFRMAGITIQGGSGVLKDSGPFNITGPGTVRLDHLHLNWQTYSPLVKHPILRLNGPVYGVMDHSILDMYSVGAIYVANGSNSGNTDFATATGFGGSTYFFVEDSILNGKAAFNNDNTTYDSRAYDCFTGGKPALRFNTLTHVTMGEDHGTGHAGDDRGCRSHEIYGNVQTSDYSTPNGSVELPYPSYVMLEIQSGTALAWGNQSIHAAKLIFTFNVTRKDNATYPQTTPPNGWGYCGTAQSGTGSNWDQSASTTTGYACLDQPGRGVGDLLSGQFPNKINVTNGNATYASPNAWPRQALEPIYIWANTTSVIAGWGGTTYNDNTLGRVVANRDYYAQASGVQTSASSPFDGTTGTGWGTKARRPTTCTAGVAYWATDEGAWNTSASNPYGVQQSGADGNLYTCTSTNTWTLYYTPYTYPHPLNTSGGVSAPTAPTNVRIR